MLNLLLIFGGCSPEYAVSLQSASAVARQLDPAKYNLIMLGISQQGRWYHFHGDVSQIDADSWQQPQLCTPAAIWPERSQPGLLLLPADAKCAARLLPVDAALPVLHGQNGEDGTVQGLLELAGLPLVGCGTLASALCMDKVRAHQLAAAAGVAVPEFVRIDRKTAAAEAARLAERIGWPLFVKPVRAGSSFGISRLSNPAELPAALQAAFVYDDEVILEAAVAGVEIGCAVMGNPADPAGLITGELDEIELPKELDSFFDFHEKYTLESSAIHVPARVGADCARRLKQTACRIYQALGCQVLARVDMFLTPQGEIYFNEVNTIPGFTTHSRFPQMLQAAGWSFPQLLDKAIELALQPREAQNA